MSLESLKERAAEYAEFSRLSMDLARPPLGDGTDGAVWLATQDTARVAIKAFFRPNNYSIELECYRRFAAHRVTTLRGFAVPQYRAHDDRLMVIEMGVVTPPYILDFAKSYLDVPPDFSAETMSDWEQDGVERFEGNWQSVKSLIWALEKYGIYYLDAKPGNIAFANDQDK